MLNCLLKNKLWVLFAFNISLLTFYHFKTFLNSDCTISLKFEMVLLEMLKLSCRHTLMYRNQKRVRGH